MDEVRGADFPFKADVESNIYCINMFVSINMHAAEDAVPFTNISILEFQVASTFRTCTLRVPPAMWLGGISHFNPFYRWECPMFFHSPLALGLDRVVFFPHGATKKSSRSGSWYSKSLAELLLLS